MKVVLKAILILLPVVLVLGFVRMSVNPDQDFLLDFNGLLKMFQTMPDFGAQINNAVSLFNEAVDVNANAWVNVVDVASFFDAIAAFFTMVGQAVGIGFEVLTIPFSFVAWFVSTFFSFSGAGVSA